jgi:hypothetical protein
MWTIVLTPWLMLWNKFVDAGERRNQCTLWNDVYFNVVWRYEMTSNSGTLELVLHCHGGSNFVKCIKAMWRCSLDKTQLAKRKLDPSVCNRAERELSRVERHKRQEGKFRVQHHEVLHKSVLDHDCSVSLNTFSLSIREENATCRLVCIRNPEKQHSSKQTQKNVN